MTKNKSIEGIIEDRLIELFKHSEDVPAPFRYMPKIKIGQIAKSIAKIPCKKCKELEETLKSRDWRIETHENIADELTRAQDKEIQELKAELIECHNKNTELKGDIAKGNKILQDEIDKLNETIEYMDEGRE